MKSNRRLRNKTILTIAIEKTFQDMGIGKDFLSRTLITQEINNKKN